MLLGLNTSNLQNLSGNVTKISLVRMPSRVGIMLPVLRASYPLRLKPLNAAIFMMMLYFTNLSDHYAHQRWSVPTLLAKNCLKKKSLWAALSSSRRMTKKGMWKSKALNVLNRLI